MVLIHECIYQGQREQPYMKLTPAVCCVDREQPIHKTKKTMAV